MDLVAILAWVLLGILIWYTLKPVYEHLSLNASNIWLDRLTGEFELFGLSWTQVRVGGTALASMTPDTCPKDKPEYDAGLCYPKCRDGYHGIGPVCWADTHNIGVGTPVGLEPCPDGWEDWGLVCHEPISCSGDAWKPVWDPGHWRCRGGNVEGRLNHGGICPGPGGGDDHTDKVDGLCYLQCPEDLPSHVPGMPYLCYKGGDLSYGRGVGKVPGLFQFLSKTDYEINI
jgi:hypothetical protein